MAIATWEAGVKPGYKTKRAAKHGLSVWRRTHRIMFSTARELSEFLQDEIVYATIDTLRLLEAVRYIARIRRAPADRAVREWRMVHEHEGMLETGGLLPSE
jgi:hypothetical protein